MTAAIGKPNTLPGRLRRVLAPNPSAMTGPGTFTDIVGERVVAIIDPGPDIDSHLAAVLAALEPGEAVAAILVTHPHLDHSALAPRLGAEAAANVLDQAGVRPVRAEPDVDDRLPRRAHALR